jgi:hypothetical protein
MAAAADKSSTASSSSLGKDSSLHELYKDTITSLCNLLKPTLVNIKHLLEQAMPELKTDGRNFTRTFNFENFNEKISIYKQEITTQFKKDTTTKTGNKTGQGIQREYEGFNIKCLIAYLFDIKITDIEVLYIYLIYQIYIRVELEESEKIIMYGNYITEFMKEKYKLKYAKELIDDDIRVQYDITSKSFICEYEYAVDKKYLKYKQKYLQLKYKLDGY